MLTSPEAMPKVEQVKPWRWQTPQALAPFALVAIFLGLGVCAGMFGW